MEHTTDSETLTSLPEDIDAPINELDPKPSTEANGEKRKRDETEEEENGEPKKALHPLWKTSLCSFFRSQSGVCSHGETCRFAHSEDELQPRPDNTWDPTSQRAKKLLKAENGEKVEKVEVPDAREDVLMTDELGDSSDPALNKCLVPLPKNWTSDSLKNFLNQKGILYKSAKKKKGMTVGFVSFETQDQRNKAFEGLDGNTLPNHKTIKLADVRPRSFEKKTTNSSDKSAKPPMETESTCEDPTVSLSLEGQENGETDDPNVDNSSSKVRTARDAVTPLAHMPYSSQLEHKKNSLEQALKRLTRSARKACPDGISLPEWILKSREIGGLPCKLEGIIESPLVNGYRNKCEFSVGYSLQGTPTVGFMLGNFREGVTAVEEPTDCPNVSKIACRFASIFQEFLQHSGFQLWNRLNNTGFWRQLTVREGRKPDQVVGVENLEANISEVLLMVQVCSTGVDDELIKSEYQRLAHAFVQGATAIFPHLPLTSLVVQDHKGVSNVAPADAPLLPLPIPKAENASGEPANGIVETRIHDYISNLRFSISPTAFFQVNTLAAEKLYSLAGDWAGLGPDTLLFDICCGTGTIGLTLAHHVGMVVGIEMNASAVSDAHKNAENNGVKNCKFVCAKAEDVMGSLLKEYLDVPDKQEETPHASENNGKGVDGDKGNNTLNDKQNSSEEKKETVEFPQKQYKDVVAIVDPPRVGLHHVVIKALRTHPRLRRLVYISCNPESLVANAIELCTPSSDKVEKGKKDNWGWKNTTAASLARRRTKSMPNSEPFHPVRAIAVDLFPHTPHCEMVMLLER